MRTWSWWCNYKSNVEMVSIKIEIWAATHFLLDTTGCSNQIHVSTSKLHKDRQSWFHVGTKDACFINFLKQNFQKIQAYYVWPKHSETAMFKSLCPAKSHKVSFHVYIFTYLYVFYYTQLHSPHSLSLALKSQVLTMKGVKLLQAHYIFINCISRFWNSTP